MMGGLLVDGIVYVIRVMLGEESLMNSFSDE
jgi:hypothetical protein